MRETLTKLDGLSRRQLLAGAARSALGVGMLSTLGSPALAAAPPGKAKRLISLFMSGGMSHLDTLDVKPGSEGQGKTGSIATSLPGIRLSEYLPTLAGQLDRIAIIRSMTTQTADHEQGEYLMRTSYDQIATERHPSIGPWIQRLLGRSHQTLPDTVLVAPPPRHPAAGFLDPSYSPLPIGDPSKGLENTEPPAYLTDQSFAKRLELIDAFDRRFREKYPLEAVRSYTDFYDQAAQLLTSGDLEAFDLHKETDTDRDRYGRNPFGQGCMLARRLIEHDVRCVDVTLAGWDMHNGLWDGTAMPQRAGTIDQAVGTLLDDLAARGLLDETLVVLTTEFGRSPEVNATAGRDHHPAVFSAMLAGAGIKGGHVHGRSDGRGHLVEEDGVRPADLNATIAEAMGLPRDEKVMSPTLRPFTVANEGTPIASLLS
ncbi:MAG: DUF1501 domain-containing protein [Planctomycetia bacterium]